MTVAHKDPLNLQLPQHGEGSLTERNRSLETELIRRTAGEVGSSLALGDHRLYFQTLREMLESDNYQVALVPRGRWDPPDHRGRIFHRGVSCPHTFQVDGTGCPRS